MCVSFLPVFLWTFTAIAGEPIISRPQQLIPEESVRTLDERFGAICGQCGFPGSEEFKWSAPTNSWMRSGLTGEPRQRFFRSILQAAADYGAVVIVMVEDTNFQPASRDSRSPEEDVTRMFLERVDNEARARRSRVVIVTDRPGGGRTDEDKFLESCLATIRLGTEYTKLRRISLTLSAPSHLSRLIQLADVVTSCTLARVAGEARYAPPVFAGIIPLMRGTEHRRGGLGLKIHPDGRYVNLYHWLLGDTGFYDAGMVHPLPCPYRPYANDPMVP
ncbi:MAG: DUF3800 domain-containing protein [Bacillota bacterium]